MAQKFKFTCYTDPMNIVSWEVDVTPEHKTQLLAHYAYLADPNTGADAAFMHCPVCDANKNHLVDCIEVP